MTLAQRVGRSIREIYRRLTSGKKPHIRPTLWEEDCGDPRFYEMISCCWQERAWLRPDFHTMKGDIAKIRTKFQSGDRIENMTNRMELYSNNLENLFEKRTKNLMECKPKLNAVIESTIPCHLVQKVKDGTAIDCEAYDSVTLMFSNIVGFGRVTPASTPQQVISLMDSLYAVFDEAISLHDVFKVDCIGCAHFLASGLPEPNDEHPAEIANLAIELRDQIEEYEVEHLSSRPLALRVGIHTGSVYTWVQTGKAMRYSVFGDCVFAAARLESSAENGKILMSKISKELVEEIGYYEFATKNEKSFWLVRRTESEI